MAASRGEAFVRRRATDQDLLEAPVHQVRQDRRWDAVHASAARTPHTRASSVLGGKIGLPFDFAAGGPGGWWILDEPALHLGDDVLVSDLAGCRPERIADLPHTSYFPLAPDRVCEVPSPSTRRLELCAERPACARRRRHLWRVDPTDRTVEEFDLQDAEWVLVACAKDDEPVSIRPLDAITWRSSRLTGKTGQG